MDIVNTVKINNLDDDCLREIFKFISPGEKLELKNICTRWNVIIEQTWFHFNELKIINTLDLKKLLGFNKISLEIIENDKIIGNMLRKYGKYIKYINLKTFTSEIKYELHFVLEIISQYCRNLVEISLESYDNIYNDVSLKYIFINNKNLQILKLRGNVIYGDCLYYLNHIVNLKTLELYALESEHFYYLEQSISKLNNNLMKLIVHNYKCVMSPLLYVISKTNNTFIINELELENFNTLSNNSAYINNLNNALLKLKNINLIKLKGFTLNDQTVNNLIQLKYIQTLSLKLCFITSISLSRLINFFKNQLISLSLHFNNDENDKSVIEAISNCTKLKFLLLGQYCGSNLTDKSTYHLFRKLKNLEELIFQGTEIMDDFLFNLCNLKNLKIININNCNNITKEGLKYLKYINNLNYLYMNNLNILNYNEISSLFKNLKILDCKKSKSLTNEDVFVFIKNNINLELLYLNECWYLTKELIENIIIEFENRKKNLKIIERKKKIRIYVYDTHLNSSFKFNEEGLFFIDNMILLDNNN